MKKLICLFMALSLALHPISGQEVRFVVSDGVSDGSLKEGISSNISTLLSEFNIALNEGRTLDLSSISISTDAEGALNLLWRNMPFRIDEPVIVERVLTTYAGLQVRNIPIIVKTEADPEYQELVIDMDSHGCINRVNLSIQNHLYKKLMSGQTEVSDLRYRQMILDYVEQFRTAYNKKDLDFLEKVFSDDALIITGRVIQRSRGDRTAFLSNNQNVVYLQQSKKEYLNRLRTRVFPNAKYIHVDFSDIKVSKHPSIDGYYGVMLKQGYESSNYSDEGYLFMIWDFRDESRPQIHVRTWQPYWLNEQHTKRLQDDKVFTINDFVIE